MPEVGFNVDQSEGSKAHATITQMYADIIKPLFDKIENLKEEPSQEDKENQEQEQDTEGLSDNVDYFDNLDSVESLSFNNIEVWKDGKMALGNDVYNNKFIDKLDPKTLGKLEVASQLPVGSKVEGLENVAIINRQMPGDKITELFKTDENGVITTNLNDKSKKEERVMVDGSDRARELLKKAEPNNPQITDLIKQIDKLNEQIELQQQFIDRQMKVNQSQGQVNAQLAKRLRENEKLKQARMQSPRDNTWWQKGIDKFKGLKEIFEKRKQEQRTMNTLNKLWDKNADKDSKIYKTNDYTLEKRDDYYILKGKDDKTLLEYGRKANYITENNLKPKDITNIEILRDRLDKKINKGDLGQFASIDNQTKLRNQRSQEIADKFVSIARKNNSGLMSKDGMDYQVTAKADGNVKIWRKDGETPKLIYNQSNKGQFNEMNDKDIGILSNALEKSKTLTPKIPVAQQVTTAVKEVAQTLTKRGGR